MRTIHAYVLALQLFHLSYSGLAHEDSSAHQSIETIKRTLRSLHMNGAQTSSTEMTTTDPVKRNLRSLALIADKNKPTGPTQAPKKPNGTPLKPTLSPSTTRKPNGSQVKPTRSPSKKPTGSLLKPTRSSENKVKPTHSPEDRKPNGKPTGSSSLSSQSVNNKLPKPTLAPSKASKPNGAPFKLTLAPTTKHNKPIKPTSAT